MYPEAAVIPVPMAIPASQAVVEVVFAGMENVKVAKPAQIAQKTAGHARQVEAAMYVVEKEMDGIVVV
jgi:hypothetical protein